MQQKRKKIIHNEQTIYEWDQSLEDVILYLKPPKWALKKYEAENKKQYGPNFQTQKIFVEILNKKVTIGIKGQKPFLNEELLKECNPKESFWQIEDDELVIQIGKIFKGDVWNAVFKGHQQLNVQQSEEEKKKLLLERFTEEHSGFDFSNAQVNGQCPDPRNFLGGINNQFNLNNQISYPGNFAKFGQRQSILQHKTPLKPSIKLNGWSDSPLNFLQGKSYSKIYFLIILSFYNVENNKAYFKNFSFFQILYYDKNQYPFPLIP